MSGAVLFMKPILLETLVILRLVDSIFLNVPYNRSISGYRVKILFNLFTELEVIVNDRSRTEPAAVMSVQFSIYS